MKPLAIDLFCGLGGWTEGFLAEGYDVVGFDIERHDYGTGGYPGSLVLQDVLSIHGGFLAEGYDVVGFDIERHDYGTGGYPGSLVLQDVLSIHGSQFKDATCIVASPPCQKYSYMAMPWKRAKALAAWYRQNPARIVELNALFDACFRIQHQAIEAAGRFIPLVVENVRGAQPWVGRSAWNFGSYHLWGDVPALMPITLRAQKCPGFRFDGSGKSFQSESVKVTGQDWSRFAKTGEVSPHWRMEGLKTVEHLNVRDGHSHTWHLTNQAEHERGIKGFTPNGEVLGKNTFSRKFGSKSTQRKAASAQIAKIPFPLAQHIARVFK